MLHVVRCRCRSCSSDPKRLQVNFSFPWSGQGSHFCLWQRRVSGSAMACRRMQIYFLDFAEAVVWKSPMLGLSVELLLVKDRAAVGSSLLRSRHWGCRLCVRQALRLSAPTKMLLASHEPETLKKVQTTWVQLLDWCRPTSFVTMPGCCRPSSSWSRTSMSGVI